MKPEELQARLAELGRAWDEHDMKTLVDRVRDGLRRLAEDPVERRRIDDLALRIDELGAESDGSPDGPLDDAHADDLVSAFAAGDEDAVREIYRRYAGPIRTVALRVLGRPELAEEAVQTTMLKAWRASGSFDLGRELAPWLYAIARRVAIDIYRREQREAPSPAGDDVVTPVSFERDWEAWEVSAALDELPVDEREVLRLSQLVGLTHHEIADRLGVPVGTVKSRSARAHRRLASLLRHTDALQADELNGS